MARLRIRRVPIGTTRSEASPPIIRPPPLVKKKTRSHGCQGSLHRARRRIGGFFRVFRDEQRHGGEQSLRSPQRRRTRTGAGGRSGPSRTAPCLLRVLRVLLLREGVSLRGHRARGDTRQTGQPDKDRGEGQRRALRGMWAVRCQLPRERHHPARLQRRANVRRRQRPRRRVGPPWLPARSARRLNTPHTERLACSRQTTFRWHVYEEAPCSSAPGRGLLHSLTLSPQPSWWRRLSPQPSWWHRLSPQPSWWHRLSSLCETRAETARLQTPGGGAETPRPQGAAFLCASLHARPPRLHWEPTLHKSVPKPSPPRPFSSSPVSFRHGVRL